VTVTLVLFILYSRGKVTLHLFRGNVFSLRTGSDLKSMKERVDVREHLV